MTHRDNEYSHLTAKERTRPSFPTRKLLAMGHIQGRVLDFGCGFGADVRLLEEEGFDVVGYDPYHAPDWPEGRFDTILCHYVLNVLMQREQTNVLMDVAEFLKPSGAAFYTVRRDLKRPGFRMHRKHRKRTYQTNVRLPFESVLKTKFCEIYRYQPYPKRSFVDVPENCPFCAPSAESTLLTESAQAYAILDAYPVTEGHALVLPKRHVASFFALAEPEQQACWLLVDRVQFLLRKRFGPDGFNVGVNVGNAAGQTVPHAHIHVIPRRAGDAEDPTGGVRNVIPDKGNYLDAAAGAPDDA
jgi:diadenosine tetraphosphate (Ap4A) HIT family hydrolase